MSYSLKNLLLMMLFVRSAEATANIDSEKPTAAPSSQNQVISLSGDADALLSMTLLTEIAHRREKNAQAFQEMAEKFISSQYDGGINPNAVPLD